MANSSASPNNGFFDITNAESHSGFSLPIAPGQRANTLAPPLIAYFYSRENKYFGFGHTEPEGVVIPMEIIGAGSPFSESTFALADPSAPEIAVGDSVWIEWLPMHGSGMFISPKHSVQSKDEYIPISIPDSEISSFAGRTVLVTLFHLSQSGEVKPSVLQYVYVALELGRKPVLEVEGVVDGVLKASAFPGGIKVSVRPVENMLACYGVEVLWTLDPDYWVERQRHLAVDPQQTINFYIDPVVYQSHVGRRVTVKYFIYLGARLSPNFFWNTGTATEVSFEVV
jgi:hypothetical protein